MAGSYEGRDAEIFRFLGRLPKETNGTYGSRLIDVLASDDRAAALYRAFGERNGDRLDLDQLLLFRIDDGLVREVARAADRPGGVRGVLLGGGADAVSTARFADGVRYRIEIPSVEGPDVMRAVLDEADARGVPVRRVSQGSGVMMLTDVELDEMAATRSRPRDRGVAVPRPARCLGYGRAVHPHVGRRCHRAGHGRCRAVQSPKYVAVSNTASGRFSSADVGALATLGSMRAAGDLPTRPRASRPLSCCRAQTAPRRGCSRSSVRPRSTSPRISRSADLGDIACGLHAPLSTSTSRCRTTRVASCASTTCPRADPRGRAAVRQARDCATLRTSIRQACT